MMRYIVIILLIISPHLVTYAQENTALVNLSNSQPYLGESFSYTVSFTSTLDLSNPQVQLPPFIGFAQQPVQTILSTETINGTVYNVYKQEISLYGNRVGDFIFEPAIITIADTPFQSGIQVQSNTTSVTVTSLPENPPDTFTNAIGRFDISVSLDPPVIQAGDPNQLSIIITGEGNFDQITSPSLRIPETWEVFPGSALFINSSERVQTKTFPYQIFPDQTGNATIPAILFTFFDPLTASYKTITTQEIAFTVDGEFIVQEQSSVDIIEARTLPLKPMTGQASTILPVTGFWVLWGIPPLIVFIISLSQFVSRPREQQPRRRRKQSRILQSAINRLTQAQQQSPNQIYSIVEQTIIQYIAEAYQQDVNTANEVIELIGDLSQTVQQRTAVCLEQAQSGQYAPVTQDDANKLLRRTYKTLQLIEEERS
jgi:hypothetical protein